MPISHKHKCLFIHIPKTGGTSIESALGMFGDWKIEDKQKLFGLIQSPELKKLGFISNFLQHVTLEQSYKINPISVNYISFSFVRNPWDKMVSIYSNPDNNLVEMALRKNIKIKELTFEEFIVQTQDIKHTHLEPQHRFVCNNKDEINVSFLGKFESLHEDFQQLCKALEIDVKLPHKNQSKRMTYQNYYTETTQKIIKERYSKDIELFSYFFN